MLTPSNRQNYRNHLRTWKHTLLTFKYELIFFLITHYCQQFWKQSKLLALSKENKISFVVYLFFTQIIKTQKNCAGALRYFFKFVWVSSGRSLGCSAFVLSNDYVITDCYIYKTPIFVKSNSKYLTEACNMNMFVHNHQHTKSCGTTEKIKNRTTRGCSCF